MTITPTGGALGAYVDGVDFSAPLSEEVRAQLRAAWSEHLVLVWRSASTLDKTLLEVASVFGPVQSPPARKLHSPSSYVHDGRTVVLDPRLALISNLDRTGKPVPVNRLLGSSEVAWHSDYSYDPIPPAGSLLMALTVPLDGGGDTHFNNQYLAYDELAPALKRAVEGRLQVHDNSRDSAGLPRDQQKTPLSFEDVHGARHPLVRTHPATGRRALYLGRRCARPSSYILGLPTHESEDLLDQLWAHATQPHYGWRHQWRVGDIVLWDNRACMHYRSAVDPAQPRVMHRTMVKGEPLTPG
jgi:taurine dioxygenase